MNLLKTLCAIVLTCGLSLHGYTVQSYSMPSAFHSAMGSHYLADYKRKSGFHLFVTPYISKAATARDQFGQKVQTGDRLGHMSIIGVLQGDGPSPYSFAEDLDASDPNYTYLHKAYLDIAAKNGGPALLKKPLKADDFFDDQSVGYYSMRMNYSRRGVRFGAAYTFGSGINLVVRSGVAQSNTDPEWLANPVVDSSKPATTPPSYKSHDNIATGSLEEVIDNDLMQRIQRASLANVVDMDFSNDEQSGFEDTSVELSWGRPYSLDDSEGDPAVLFTPRIACSITLPITERINPRKLFAVPLGNDGFYALGIDLGMILTFPGTISCGGGIALGLFDEQNRGSLPVPSSEGQILLYPWRTQVTKQPGSLWDFYTLMRADNFIDFASFYAEYRYTVHAKDSITLSAVDKTLFVPEKIEREGAYQAHTIHFGFEFEVTPSLRLGVSYQSAFYGKNMWHHNTCGATVRFLF